MSKIWSRSCNRSGNRKWDRYFIKVIGVLSLVLVLGLSSTGCAFSAKVVEWNPFAKGSQNESSQSQSSETEDEALRHATKPGFAIKVAGATGQVEFTVDELALSVTDLLEAPVSYYEAPGCAGEGIEKIYTYRHFVINTYPAGNQDLIASIVIMDDMVATEEGLEIGMSAEAVTSVYGEATRSEGEMLLFEKNGMELGIIVSEDKVTSIQYKTKNY